MSNKDHLTGRQIAEINSKSTPICPDCGSGMVLRRSRYGLFYGCSRYPDCASAHGAHPNGKPLGVPATAEVKKLRMRAHELLEARYGKKGYFKFLQDTLGIPRDQAHVALLNKLQLETVIAYLQENWDKVIPKVLAPTHH